jgi:hypothetical protein
MRDGFETLKTYMVGYTGKVTHGVALDGRRPPQPGFEPTPSWVLRKHQQYKKKRHSGDQYRFTLTVYEYRTHRPTLNIQE